VYQYASSAKGGFFFELMLVEYIEWLKNHFHPRVVEGDDVSLDEVLSFFDDRFGSKQSKR